MGERLRFHPLVSTDLREAIQWYERISDQLGNRFREAVDACLDEIEAQPQRFAWAFDETRFARVAKFPYLILFRESSSGVFVLGVFHTASNPEKWQRR